MAPTRGSFGRGRDRQGRGHRGNGLQPLRRDQIRQRAGNQETQTATERRLLKMVVSTLQPLVITQDANFQSFVKALDPCLQIPTTSVIRSQLLSFYQEKTNSLRLILASADHVVLTCELWASGAEDYCLTVGCHFVNKYGNLKSYMLQTTSLFGDDSAANIQNQLSAVMEAWGIEEKVHTVIRAGMPQLKTVKTKWTHMPCFADTLNVLFKDLMSDEELSNVLTKCQRIVRFFTYDAEAEKMLREIQKKLKVTQDELIMYSGDRWLPWLQMLQRLNEQYKAMVMVLDDRGKTDLILNETDKEKIRNIISALKPLKEAASTMEKGFETISAMLPLLKKLMNNLREEEKKKNLVAQTLLSKCEKKFGDVNNHVLAPITFLDPRFKNQLGEQNKKQAMTKIMKDLAAGPASSSAPYLRAVLDRYMDHESTSETSNPLSWWRHTGKQHYGELSQLALKKLGVVSTAVPLERAFSDEGDRFCKLRSSIEPENLNMILFLNSNWSTIS
ncbi:E3 SUMO-protein ligase ZBED1 [Epinephelus lanceolatus]